MLSVKRVRKLQLHVELFNQVHCILIFLLKQTCITLGILNGYAAIAHFSEHPVLGMLYYVVLLNVVLQYSIVYDKAFEVPSRFTQAVQRISRRLPKHRSREGRAFARHLRSISKVGIKVGEFHTFEKTSTPDFVDYVVKNVVNMLVAYA